MLPLSAPTLAVIVPVYNGGKDFERCLAALMAAQPCADEIIVIADGDPVAAAHAEKLGIQVIRREQPAGPAQARNQGAQLAKSELLFFVDADVVIQTQTIAQIKAVFQQEPQWTAIFGSYDDAPGASNFLSQYRNLFHHYVHQNSAEQATTFWSGCGAIRREIFLEMGGFSALYQRPAIEDIELGYRLVRAGYQIKLCKSIQVKHLKKWTPISLIQTDFFSRALPWTELILKYGKFVNDLNLRYTNRLSVILVYLLGMLLIVLPILPKLCLLAALLIMLSLIGLNLAVYRFFYQKRGLIFTCAVIPWHWLYYGYSGLAFGIGLIRFWLTPRSEIAK